MLTDDFKKKYMDSVSPCFCAEKWYNSTIWLNSGKTASCHHNAAHKISLSEVVQNPAALHNTPIKKRARKMMLRGDRPLECHYCWELEDLAEGAYADRVDKTLLYPIEDVQKIVELAPNVDVVPKYLELAFDRICNLACAYCGPQFSTSWENDLKKNGSVAHLQFNPQDYLFSSKNNPYIKAFWKWWDVLSKSLLELRVTGGEPLLHEDFWKLLDFLEQNPSDMRVSVNTNLSVPESLITKLISKVNSSQATFILSTSCESFGAQAEYTRDGLNFLEFVRNIHRLHTESKVVLTCVMMTIDATSIFSLVDFLDVLRDLKLRYGSKSIALKPNFLHFPDFLSIASVPLELRQDTLTRLDAWIKVNLEILDDCEVSLMTTLQAFLKNTPHDPALSKNFKSYFVDYDLRRGKKFENTFSKPVVDWYNSL